MHLPSLEIEMQRAVISQDHLQYLHREGSNLTHGLSLSFLSLLRQF